MTKAKMTIPVTRPYFDACEKEKILNSIESGWLVQGPYVAAFEKAFSGFSGSAFAVATSSCTAALHLALEAVGIGRGDKVIVPSFTFVASANAVEYTGAEVVFCDIDLRTFNIDVDSMVKVLEHDKGKNIKAVMAVNLFGLCADMYSIIDIAKMYNLKVIEDSACGFGAYIGNKHSGTFGEAGCFSFHPRKTITTGEGGMLVTNNKEIAEKVSMLRDHGAGKSDLKRHNEKGGSLLPEFNMKGYNYRMTDMQGAIGDCQLEKSGVILKKRTTIAEKYGNYLKTVIKLKTPYTPEGYIHGYQSYVCLFNDGEDISDLTTDQINGLNMKRNNIMARLEYEGVATRQGTHAVHSLGYYRSKYNLHNSDFVNSYAADRLSITLPLYAGMTDDEFDYVVSCLRTVLE